MNPCSNFVLKLASLMLLCSLAACQFRSPSIAEQDYLMQKGAFPSGPPAWVATPQKGGSGVGGIYSGGLIPQGYTRSVPSDNRQSLPTSVTGDTSVGGFKVPSQVKEEKKEEEAAKQAESNVPESPLHRIVKLCPNVENDVSDALQTTDLNKRIRKYESLTNRCPTSWDLWLWLGKDYQRAKKNVQAGRCFEKVVVLDNANKEAADLLAENRRQLNEKPLPQNAAGQKPKQLQPEKAAP